MAKGKGRANKHRKEVREQCWRRGEDRKALRREQQAAAAKRNRESGTSPWLQAKAARRVARQ